MCTKHICCILTWFISYDKLTYEKTISMIFFLKKIDDGI